jgi:two-component system KDP operon response regulator KdpE
MRSKTSEVGVQKKILVVGADRASQQTLCDALRCSHYHLVTSGNGDDALFQIGLSRPDLVILDLPQLGTDDWETLHRLRELYNIPIIVLGSSFDYRAEVSCLDSGADYFVSKPIGIQELCARIRALLRRATCYAATEASCSL